MTWTVRKSVERNYKINELNDYQDCHYLSGRPNNGKPRIIKMKSYLNFNIVLNLNNYQNQMIFHG